MQLQLKSWKLQNLMQDDIMAYVLVYTSDYEIVRLRHELGELEEKCKASR